MRVPMLGLLRRWRRGLAAAGFACAAVAMAAAPQVFAADGGVLKVRFGGDGAETRLVIDLSKSVSGKLVESDDPRRIVIALPGVDANGDRAGAGHGVVRRWSIDESRGSARLQIELSQGAEIKRRFLLAPGDGVDHYRYVIDLRATGPVTAVPKAQPRVMLVKARPRSVRKVIVIDAGHGGRDPGASGTESREKAITLAAARDLKARLEASGRYTVVLTREDDRYVPLEQRVQIARKAGADLFLSLHADAGHEPTTRGASVYTLSDKGTERATRAIGQQDWLVNASYSGDRAVSQILLDLTQRSTKNRSSAFAQTLLERVADETVLLRRSHRDAGFIVLFAPDVPAVLLEMGFITNPEDEALLSNARSRKRLMDAVGDSIDAYFAAQTRLAAR